MTCDTEKALRRRILFTGVKPLCHLVALVKFLSPCVQVQGSITLKSLTGT